MAEIVGDGGISCVTCEGAGVVAFFHFFGVYPSSSCGLQGSIHLWWFVGLPLELQCRWFPAFV